MKKRLCIKTCYLVKTFDSRSTEVSEGDKLGMTHNTSYIPEAVSHLPRVDWIDQTHRLTCSCRLFTYVIMYY